VKALLIPTAGPVAEVQQHGLRDLQALLHGPIGGLPVDGRHDDAAYVNERGLLDGLAVNPRATRLLGIRIAGPAVLCGFDPATGQQTPIPNDLAATVLASSASTRNAPPQS
jgi:hypothetical protein